MSGFTPPPGDPWANPPYPMPPIQPVTNPFGTLEQIDLSTATFEKKAELDPEKLATVLEEVAQLTQSNLADAAKWKNYLRILETALRSVGYVVRIAAVA